MPDSIEELRQQLAATTDRLLKIDLMLEIAESISSTDPADGLQLAKKAHRLAVICRDKGAIARSNVITGVLEYHLGNSSAALGKLHAGLDSSREIGDRKTEAKALQWIGIGHTDMGEHVMAFDVLGQSLELALEIGDRVREASVRNSLGCACDTISDYAGEIEHLYLSRKIYEELNNTSGMFQATSNMGVAYMALDNLTKAHEQFLCGAVLAASIGNRRFDMTTMTNLGLVLQRLGQYQDSLDHFLNALEIARQLNAQWQQTIILYYIGTLRINRNEYAEALDVLHEGLRIAEQTGDAARWSILATIGEVHLHLGEVDVARDMLMTAMAGAEAAGNRSDLYGIHKLLADLYETEGEAIKALQHHKLYTRIREEIVGQEQQRAMMQVEMRAEIERAEREREILRLEKQQLQMESERKTRELAAMALNLVEKTQFLDSLKKDLSDVSSSATGSAGPKMRGLLRRIDGNLTVKKDWLAFETQFEQVHDGFLGRLSDRHPDLTRMELKICALVRINLASKEIAELLQSSLRTIEWHRLRIRKKLDPPQDTGLLAYLESI